VSAPGSAGRAAILLTGVGKRYDIVSCFAQATRTLAADPNPLAPARYAAQLQVQVPPMRDPAYVPTLLELCAEHRVGAVLPLTDLDIETLAGGREEHGLPALVPSAEVARATFDKYEAHLLFVRVGLPSPPTALPDQDVENFPYPAMIKPRRGSGARSIHLARDPAEARFFISYLEGSDAQGDGAQWGGDVKAPVGEQVMIQRAMRGEELSIDCLGDAAGRCLNAIPRQMIESRGGESVKGTVVHDEELIELGRHAMESLGVRGPATIQVFRDPEVGLAITDFNTRFGGAFPAPALAALPGRTYPELIVRIAAGEHPEPHVGEFKAPLSFTRYYWQLELDAGLRPTGRDIVPGGPPAPRLRSD
jgi:carbamoyl-phosphate synthase large subunit